MKRALRLYSALVRALYPRVFRDEFAREMELCFRDQLFAAKSSGKIAKLLGRTIIDLPAGAAREWRDRKMKPKHIAAYLVFAALMLAMGRYDLRTDDSGVELFGIALIAGLMTLWCPERRWLWCFTGMCAPIAELVTGRSKLFPDMALLALVLTAVGTIASQAAYFVRTRLAS